MNNDHRDSAPRETYNSPTLTTLEVSEATAGGGTGFSDVKGHKQEGGSCLPDAEVSLPPRAEE